MKPSFLIVFAGCYAGVAMAVTGLLAFWPLADGSLPRILLLLGAGFLILYSAGLSMAAPLQTGGLPARPSPAVVSGWLIFCGLAMCGASYYVANFAKVERLSAFAVILFGLGLAPMGLGMGLAMAIRSKS